MRLRSTVGLLVLLLAPGPARAQLLRSPALALGASLGANMLGAEVEARPVRHVALVARADGFPLSENPSAAVGIRLDVLGDRFARVFVLPMAGAVQCPVASDSGAATCQTARWRTALSGVIGWEVALSEKARWSLGIQAGYRRVLAEPGRNRLSGAVIDAVLRWRVPLSR